jgi:HK97 family phage portal protein
MPKDMVETPQLGSSAVISLPQPPLRKTEEYLKAYTSYTFTAISAIAQEIGSIDLHLFSSKYVKGVPIATEVYEHEALSLLHYINPLTTFYDITEATQIYLELTGESFWVVLKQGTTPREIWLLRPDWVSIVPSKDKIIDHYVYHPGGSQLEKVDIPRDNIIHFKYFNPLNPYRGKGSVQAAALPLDIHTFAQEWNRNFFFNSAIPGLVFSNEKPLSDKSIQRFLTQWQSSYSGRANANKIAFLGGGMKVDKVTASGQEMDFAEQQRMMRDDILAVFKVPKTILGLTDDVNRCYSEDTEVLTNSGFKYYHQVLPTDKIATINQQTDKIEYHPYTERFEYDYDGEMVLGETENVSLLVTPNHKLWRRTLHGNNEYQLVEAGKIEKHIAIKASFDYEGEELEKFIIPFIERKNGSNTLTQNAKREVLMDDFLEYLGYFISEGGLLKETSPNFRYIHTLSQKDLGNVNKIHACLTRLGFSFTRYGDEIVRWNVYGKALNSWLREQCGDDCAEKRIPEVFKAVSKRQLRILFNALMLGDGSWDKRENRKSGYYATTSRRLADDVQELATKLGYSASVAISYEADGNRRRCFVVHIVERKEHILREAFSTINYQGNVWCFEVPNHVFIVRRNGKITAQGNSNAEATTKAFMERVVTPRMKKFVGCLNEFLLSMYGDESLFFDFTDPAPADTELMLKRYENARRFTWMTPNEIRTEQNMKPIEGGDDLFAPLASGGGGPGAPVAPKLAPSSPAPTGGKTIKLFGFTITNGKNEPEKAEEVVFAKPFKHMMPFPVKRVEAIHRETIERGLVKDVTELIMRMIKIKSDDDLMKEFKKKKKEARKTEPLFTEETKLAYWKQFIKQTDTWTGELKDKAIDIFKEQEHIVLDNIDNNVKYWKPEVRKGKESSVLPSGDEFDAMWMVGFMALVREILIEQGDYTLDFLGVGGHLNLSSDPALEFLQTQGADLIKGINETTRDQLRATLAEGFEAGEGIGPLKVRVKKVFKLAIDNRAEMIARTESLRASNFATVEAYRQSGVVVAKQWLTTRLPNVCPMCADLEGKIIGVNEDYFKAGDTITAGDETLKIGDIDIDAPPLHVNCGCTTIPVLTREKKI